MKLKNITSLKHHSNISALLLTGNMVLRIPVLYGDVEYLEESAVTVLFKKLKEIQGKPGLRLIYVIT